MQTFTVTNGSPTDALTITGLGFNGTDPGEFVKGSATTCARSNPVPAGGTCIVTVAFRPTSLGEKSAKLKLVDSAADSPQYVPITGTGTP